MPSWPQIRKVTVAIKFGNEALTVGRLAERDGRIYFEYDSDFLDGGLELSPFMLPLAPGVKQIEHQPFAGLPGVFNDSLPDGWGKLLIDRMIRKQGMVPDEISVLARLTQVERHGIGALLYQPDHSTAHAKGDLNLDQLALATEEVLKGSAEDVLEELVALNGSSAGARPKALVGFDQNNNRLTHGTELLANDFEHWLVKFSNSNDGSDAGAIEYVYALMADDAGVQTNSTHLFPAQNGSGYFATQRFDREAANSRLHCHTVCGLLHSDHQSGSLDYEALLSLTTQLTRDMREVEKMFRLAVFNVLAHNRDDHSKNFSFLMNAVGEWRCAPAYDLTFSTGIGTEQTTMVMGEGRNPGIAHLKQLGNTAKLAPVLIEAIIEQTCAALAKWSTLAKQYDVAARNIELITNRLKQLQAN